jgi:hypothetical protein
MGQCPTCGVIDAPPDERATVLVRDLLDTQVDEFAMKAVVHIRNDALDEAQALLCRMDDPRSLRAVAFSLATDVALLMAQVGNLEARLAAGPQ